MLLHFFPTSSTPHKYDRDYLHGPNTSSTKKNVFNTHIFSHKLQIAPKGAIILFKHMLMRVTSNGYIKTKLCVYGKGSKKK